MSLNQMPETSVPDPSPDAPPPQSGGLSAADFARKLGARDKTIEVLKRRIRQQACGSQDSPFALLEQNISLGAVIARKTVELETERQ